MPTNFDQTLDVNKFQFAHNNNAVRTSNYPDPVYAVFSAENLETDIFPDPQGNMYMNFKDDFKLLTNSNDFAVDVFPDIAPSISSTWIAEENNVQEITCGVHTYFDPEGDTPEYHATFKCLVLGGAIDAMRAPRTNRDKTAFLLRNNPDNMRAYYLQYSEGFPCSISFYMEGSSVTVENLTTAQSYTYTKNSSLKWCRLYLDGGATNTSIGDVLPIQQGRNVLRIQGREEVVVVDYIDACDDDLYVAFRNAFGAVSYWNLGNIYRQAHRSAPLGDLDRDMDNIDNEYKEYTTAASRGRNTADSIDVLVEGLTPEKWATFGDLLDAPRVFLYRGRRFNEVTPGDWVEVKISATTATSKNYKNEPAAVALTLQFDNNHTATL